MGETQDETPPEYYHIISEEGESSQEPPKKEEENAEVSLKGYYEVFRYYPCYIFLFLSAAVSNMGDMFNTIATIGVLQKYAGSSLALSGFLIIRLVAPTMFSPISGVVVDKFKPLHVMVLSDFTRGIVVLGFLLVRSKSTISLVYVFSFIQFALSSFFEPARTSLIPQLVGRRHVVPANALDMIGFSITTFLGSSLGGVVTSFFGADVNYLIDSGSYFLSAAFLIGVALTPKLKEHEEIEVTEEPATENESEEPKEEGADNVAAEPEVESSNPFVMYLAGMKYMIFQKRDTFWLTLFKASGNIVLGVADVVNVNMANKDFNLGRKDGSLSLGIMYGIGGVGCVVGPLVSSSLSVPTPLGFRKSMGAAFFILTLGTMLAGWSPHAAVWFGGNFLVDASNTVVYVLLTAVLQMEVEAKYRGRVFAFGMGVRTMVSAVGTLGSAVLLDAGFNEHQVYMCASAITLLTALAWVVVYYPAFYAKLKAKGELPEEDTTDNASARAHSEVVISSYLASSQPSQVMRLRNLQPDQGRIML